MIRLCTLAAACAVAAAAEHRRTWLALGRPWLYERAIVTTCGLGEAANNRGRWKPRRMLDGVATMARSARRFTSLPIVFLAFDDEDSHGTCLEAPELRAANAARGVAPRRASRWMLPRRASQ